MKLKQLFEQPISDLYDSSQFKNAIYITFILSLKDFREKELYKSRGEVNKWYINLLEHVVDSDVADLTEPEKQEISKDLNGFLSSKLEIVTKMIDELESVSRPQNQKKLIEYSNAVFEFPKNIEDTYIKNRILGLEDRSIEGYLNSLGLREIFDRINDLKRGKKFNETEIMIFESISSIKYVAYSFEIDGFLTNKIPRYTQYMAMKMAD